MVELRIRILVILVRCLLRFMPLWVSLYESVEWMLIGDDNGGDGKLVIGWLITT